MAILKLKFKDEIIGEYLLQSGVSIKVGRREDNDLTINDPAVSGHHAKIESIGSRFVLIDLQSSNGTFVNEQLVNSHWLRGSDVISIGEHTLVFELTEEDPKFDKPSDRFDDTQVMKSSQYKRMMKKSTPHKSINVVRFWDQRQNQKRIKVVRPQNLRPAAERSAGNSTASLSHLAGGNGHIELTRKITTIGKHPTSDIVVKGLLMGQTAVTIRLESDGYYLNYIAGQPKPKVNGLPVKGTILLANEDIIELGSTRLQFNLT
jgi:pSer/pThr/pTyr-binding forkhead associated (FHA) protein